jgi:hypothetical protein
MARTTKQSARQVVCIEPHVRANREGGETVVSEGQRLSANDPLVKSNPSLFVPDEGDSPEALAERRRAQNMLRYGDAA